MGMDYTTYVLLKTHLSSIDYMEEIANRFKSLSKLVEGWDKEWPHMFPIAVYGREGLNYEIIDEGLYYFTVETRKGTIKEMLALCISSCDKAFYIEHSPELADNVNIQSINDALYIGTSIDVLLATKDEIKQHLITEMFDTKHKTEPISNTAINIARYRLKKGMNR